MLVLNTIYFVFFIIYVNYVCMHGILEILYNLRLVYFFFAVDIFLYTYVDIWLFAAHIAS